MANQRIADFIQAAPALTGAAVAAGDVIPIYDASADAMKSLTPAELSTALGGGGGILTASVTMTDAQIKASPTSGFELFAPLGADQAYLPIGGYAVSNIVAAYTNQTNLREITIGWDDDSFDAVGALHYNAGDVSALLTSSSVAPIVPLASILSAPSFLVTYQTPTVAQVMNKNLALYVDNPDGNFTGGNAANTLKFVIYYAIATP